MTAPRLRFISACVAGTLSLPASAQTTPIERAVAALPDMVAGVSRIYDETSGKPLAVYSGKLGLDPLIAVAYAQVAQTSKLSEVRGLARGSAEQANVLKTVFEGRFSVPGKPSATTFFGEYLTERGLKQVWLFEDAGLRTVVAATIFQMKDRGRVFDAVRIRLLGGATMVKEPPMTVVH